MSIETLSKNGWFRWDQLSRVAAHPGFSLVLYLIFFLFLFFPLHGGVGQYWDWSFPYYQSDIGNFFSYKAYSWVDISFGKPLGYNSDFLFRFLVSRIKIFPPETLVYLLCSSLFAVSSFVVFQSTRAKVGSLAAFFLGLAALANPAMLYKVVAGHLNYLASFALFTTLVWYLLRRYQGRIRDAIIVGLLWALVGFQIQFFLFGFLVIASYFVYHRSFPNFRQISLIVLLPFCINFFWFSNLLLTQAVSSVASTAQSGSFVGLSQLGVLNIFNLSFSKATLISRYFSSEILLFLSCIFAVTIFSWFQIKTKDTSLWTRLLFILFVTFALGSGLFSSIPLLKTIAPMFREVGHFAPLMVLFLLLSLQPFRSRVARVLLVVYLALFVGVSSWCIRSVFPVVDFSQARTVFSEQRDFQRNRGVGYMFMAYPFFKPFGTSFIDDSTQERFRLNDAGSDNFSTFAQARTVSSIVPPTNLKESVQYAFYRSRSIDFLKHFSIRYLLDLSNVYESFYDKYVPSKAYDNDLTLIKADPNFLPSLAQDNPDDLVDSGGTVFAIPDAKAVVHGLSQILVVEGTDFTLPTIAEFYKSKLFPEAGFVKRLVDISSTLSKVTGSIRDVSPVLPSELARVQNGDVTIYRSLGNDGSQGIEYSQGVAKILLPKDEWQEGWSLLFPRTAQVSSDVASGSLSITTNDTPSLEESHEELEIGLLPATITFSEGGIVPEGNIVPNGSFKNGLWQEKVSDCFKYDDNPDIQMQFVTDADPARDGVLQLEATRHVACTSIIVPITEGRYLFSFNSKTSTPEEFVGFHLQFNDEGQTFSKDRFASGTKEWRNVTRQVDVPSGVTEVKVYLYAFQSDKQTKNSVQYDDVSLEKIPSFQGKYFLVRTSSGALLAPQAVNSTTLNPTKRLVHIKGATTPFYLSMSESYHPQWRLAFNDRRVGGWLSSWTPVANPHAVPDEHHFELNGFLNGWYVDTEAYCNRQALCTRNADGSYDMEMVIEFTPQRWFYVGLIISGTTLIGCLGYLGVAFARRRKNKKIPPPPGEGGKTLGASLLRDVRERSVKRNHPK